MTQEAAKARAAQYEGMDHLEARAVRRGRTFVVELRRRAGGAWFTAPRA